MTEAAPSTPTRKGPPRWFLIVAPLIVIAGITAVVDANKTPQSNDRAGGKDACVQEAGGQVLDARFDSSGIFAVGQDGGQTWTCEGEFIDGEWVVFVRPGG